MKEREEDFKTKQMSGKKTMSPYIFAGLTTEKQGMISGVAKKYDVEMGLFEEMEIIAKGVSDETGYSLSQLRQPKKGRIGLTTTRQVFVLLSKDKGIGSSTVGRFIKRDHASVIFTDTQVRERIGNPGYELLTTVYNQVKENLQK
jgi:hypothetical protein